MSEYLYLTHHRSDMGLVKILQHIFPTTDNIFRFILPSDKNIQGCAGKANHVKAENNSPTGCNELSGSQPQDDVQLLVNESWNQNKFYYWSVQSKYREIPLSRLGKQFRSWHPAWVQNLPSSPFTGNLQHSCRIIKTSSCQSFCSSV